MPPVTQPVPQDNSALLNAIKELGTSLRTDIDSRFTEYDKRFEQVDRIDGILTEAQKAQAEEQERLRQQREARQRQEYKPQSAEQLRRDAAEDAYQRIQREQAEEKARHDREASIATQEEQELDAQLDRDIAALRRAGYLPEVINSNDPNDPGRFAEDELLARAAQLETPMLSAVADELAFHHRNNEYYDIRTRSYKSAENILHPLAGKTAPVGNSSVNSGSPSFSGPTAAELRNMSMRELSELAKTRGYGPAPTVSTMQPGF